MADQLSLIDNVAPHGPSQQLPGALVSPDGEYVYYNKGPGLYVHHDGEITEILPEVSLQTNYVGSGPTSYELQETGDCKTGALNADGTRLAFSGVTGVEANDLQVFRYDAEEDELIEISPPGVESGLGGACGVPTPRVDVGTPISSDGERIFFESKGALVGRDINGVRDVYEWHNGRISLISNGTSPEESLLYGTDEKGENVFFVSADRLTSTDGDRSYDVYVARANGGFPDRVVPDCEGEACRGPASQPPSQSSAGTATFRGPSNVKPKRKKAKKKKAKAKKKAAKKKRGKRARKSNKSNGRVSR